VAEFVLPLRELPVLLNILMHAGNDKFRVHSYLLDQDLFSIDLEGGTVDRLIERRDFQRSYEALLEPGEDESNIVPPFNLLRRCLIGAGVWEMGNWGTIKKKLDEIKIRNPLKGERITLIGFDTNSFMNRIYSVMQHIYKRDITKFGFVLSRRVHLELRTAQKIKNPELEALKAKLNCKDILGEFWNQPTLLARQKMVGLAEFNKLKLQSNYVINDGLAKDDRDADLQIMDDLWEQTRVRNYDLLLISADKDFQVAREPGVDGNYLKNPDLKQIPQRFSGSWEQICDFIYLLSVFFGALSMRSKDTIQTYGIWRGKEETDWDTESIKVKIGSEALARLLRQQLEILHPTNA